MPGRSSNGKAVGSEIMEKLRARKPAQICKKRPARVVAKRQLQRRKGVIVTMSVEQSGGISLNTSEGVAMSHSRKISTASALFTPMGVSIGVVCESTTENKEGKIFVVIVFINYKCYIKFLVVIIIYDICGNT